MLSIIGNRKIIVTTLMMVLLIYGVQGISYGQAAPDLTVAFSGTGNPTSATSGELFTLSFVVTNVGDAASTATELRCYSSDDNSVNTPTDEFVGAGPIPAVSASSPNNQVTVKVPLIAPDVRLSSTPLSRYYYASVVAVSNDPDTNNTTTTLHRVTVSDARPDLQVSNVSLVGSSSTYTYPSYTGTPGEFVTFTATVTNGGDAVSPTNARLELRRYDRSLPNDLGLLVDSTSIRVIAPTGSIRLNLSTQLPFPTYSTQRVYDYRYRVQVVSQNDANSANDFSDIYVTITNFDLSVATPTVDKSTLTPGESFTLSTTVTNQGSGISVPTTLRYYRSTDTTLSSSDDTEVGTDPIAVLSGNLSGNYTSSQSITLTAPTAPGDYYYYVSVDRQPGEGNAYSNTSSTYVKITVSAPPDLVAELFELRGTSALAPGERFTLDATVTNEGVGQSAATTLRFYESIDRRFRSEDEVGRVSVSALASNISSNESVRLVAPSEPGTYYYRAHVDEVANEAVTSNNWSGYIVIFVEAPLVIESLQPSKFALSPGERFTLTATIKNDGDAVSTRTVVEYYLSVDDSITSRDTSIGTDTVSAIAAGRTTQVSRTLTAPNAAGTYYYGVCVGDDISSDTCAVIRITVVAVLIDASQRPPMYWVDADVGALQSLTGSRVDRLVPNVQNATSVAVDMRGNRVYWTEQTGDHSGRIRRANLNGTSIQLVRELTSAPRGLVLDTANGKLYLTSSRGKVQRMNLDGSSFQPDLIVNLESPRGVAVDTAGGKVYWTEQTSDRSGRIRRANLNGTNVQLVQELTSVPHGLVLDTANGKLYLTNGWGKVQRMNLDGSGFQPDLIVNLKSPRGVAVDTAGGKVYWTEEGKIGRANLDGSNRQDVATGLGTPDGIFLQTTPIEIFIRESQRPPMYWANAGVGTLQSLRGASVDRLVPNVQNATSVAVDMRGGKVYWTERTGDQSGRIQRANLNGTNIQLVRELTSAPYRLALDTANGKLYLTNGWGKVQRMNLDGSGFQPDLIINLESPRGVAVDTAGGKVYWTEQTSDTSGRIRRANLNGSNVQLVRELTSVPHGLALDTASRKLYLTNGWGKVQQMNLNGSGFQPDFIINLESPRGVAVDRAGRKIYWTERGRIRRANLDGSNRQDVATGLGTPISLALSVAPGSTPSAPAAAAVARNATALHPNYPNPFNPETWIPYQLQKPADVQISIYSQSGVLVRELSLGYQRAGQYMSRSRAAYWDGRNHLGEPVASGLYFYTLTAGDFSATRRMLILK